MVKWLYAGNYIPSSPRTAYLSLMFGQYVDILAATSPVWIANS